MIVTEDDSTKLDCPAAFFAATRTKYDPTESELIVTEVVAADVIGTEVHDESVDFL